MAKRHAIFLRSATPGSATLTAAAVEDVAHSHVYLYTRQRRRFIPIL